MKSTEKNKESTVPWTIIIVLGILFGLWAGFIVKILLPNIYGVGLVICFGLVIFTTTAINASLKQRIILIVMMAAGGILIANI